VSYDGQKLSWPTWTSTQEIEQAIGNADWLRKELKERLGIEVRVKAALTFPGWYVNGGPPSAPVLVENPKRLPICLSQRFRSELPDDKIDLIRRHLDAKSRDVTFEPSTPLGSVGEIGVDTGRVALLNRPANGFQASGLG
jgi:hypothetical protein